MKTSSAFKCRAKGHENVNLNTGISHVIYSTESELFSTQNFSLKTPDKSMFSVTAMKITLLLTDGIIFVFSLEFYVNQYQKHFKGNQLEEIGAQ